MLDQETYFDILYYQYSTLLLIVGLFVSVIFIISTWKMYEKAGEPGWASIIPFYNSYIFYKIATGHGWAFLLTFIPCVGLIYQIYATYKLAQNFGKGVGFTIGLLLVPFVFFPIMGFDDSQFYGYDDTY